MVTKEVVGIIKKRREGGITDEQIHALLENQGYKEDDIVAAIDASYKDMSNLPSEIEMVGKPKKKGWWPF